MGDFGSAETASACKMRSAAELLGKLAPERTHIRTPLSVVSVRGSVANPGELTLDAREMTLSRALARAGISPVAGSYIEIRRPKRSATGAVEYDVQTVQRADLDELRVDPRLKTGDDIFVPKAPVYYMNGYVKTSGAMVWKPGLTVGEAIAAAARTIARTCAPRPRTCMRTWNGSCN